VEGLNAMREVGVALIGTGSIADYHIAGLAAVPQAALRVVVGRDAAKAASLAARHGVAEASVDLDAVLARRDIEAVVIATPDDTHEEMAVRVASAGKAILLQKPMAADADACERIIATAWAAKVDLQVSFMHRYFEEFVAARVLVEQGAIGTLLSLRARNATPGPDWGDWFFSRTRVSGGVVHQLGVHGIDLVGLIAGRISDVSATTAIQKPRRRLADGREVTVENPDSAWAVYRCAGGVVVAHEMSMIEVAGCDRFRLEIYGSDGTIWLRSEHGPLAIRRGGESCWSIPDLSFQRFGERHHRRWIEGILGITPPEATAQDALQGIRVSEAIARSAAAGGARVAVASA
jgi:predicted dehydrogenase